RSSPACRRSPRGTPSMRPETRAELARRLRHYLDTGTTAMAEAMFPNPVSAYTSEERLALEKRVLFRESPLLVGLSCRVAAPGEEGFAGLSREEHSLRRLPVAEKYGLVWVQPAPAGPEATIDIDAHLGGLAPELASFGFERWHHFETRTLRPRINWKMAVDTFLEAYHLAALHEQSVAPIFVGNLCTADRFGPHHRMIAVRRSFAALRDSAEAERD